MVKHVLKVKEDFYQKDIKEGDVIRIFGGSLKVVDLHYQNENGVFILCEYDEKHPDPTLNDKWNTKTGVGAEKTNQYEIIGTIHVPDYRNLLAGIGFYVKNHEVNEVLGLSYEQTWNLVFHEGCRNAVATSSHYQNFHTKLIDSVEGLPAFDSCYWNIPAYDSNGTAFASLTKEALKRLEKGIKHVVEQRVRERVADRGRVLTEVALAEVTRISEEIKKSEKIVVLTGAGISTNSGIPDYRSSVESMWQKNPRVLEQLHQQAFEKNPRAFWNAFYQLIEESVGSLMPFCNEEALIATMKAIKHNDGHQFFAWIEEKLQKNVTVVTQNVDGLHTRAGSSSVIEMHGNIQECVCSECRRGFWLTNVLKKNHVPTCGCGGVLRPDVVFFGDSVHDYECAVEALQEADLLIVAGTSLQVYPFNQLLYEKNDQAKVILINQTPVDGEFTFDHAAYGDLSVICKKVKELLGER